MIPAVASEEARVFVVDDDALMVDLAGRILRRAGYRQVEASTDPTRALHVCREFRPDVMLLDFQMPGLDGLEVMAALNASDIETKPAVIMLTGEADAAVRTMAYEKGARDYVTKPFDRRELLARVANAVESVRLTRGLEAAVAERTSKLDHALEVLRQAERQLARQLEQSEAESRSKSGLLAETVHELRTPLNAILAYSEVLRDQLIGPVRNDNYKEYAGHIHDAGRHLLKLVDQLLELSRAELGEDKPQFAPVDVGAVVRQSAAMLSTQAAAAGVKLDIRIDPALQVVRTDSAKLSQIILNLGSNAVKYTPAGGRVTIEALPDPSGGVMVLVVRDTGMGIAPEHMELVMRPFGRTPEARASGISGTGLGLPLTRRYVEMLGGRLDIQSVPGCGTIVTVRLPVEPKAVGHETFRRPAARI